MTGHRFEAAHAGKLKAEERRRIQPPEGIIEYAAPDQDAVAADLGCGNGYVAVPLQGHVKRLFAVDAQIEMLRMIEGADMDMIVADIQALPFYRGAFDHAFMISVAHEFEDLGAILARVREIVGKGGRLTIVEHQKKESPIGPPLHERIDREEILKHCKGWKELRHLDKEYYYQIEMEAV
jgi:ubiquinone/menaquinone biosynthesis C-methylase UbiE